MSLSWDLSTKKTWLDLSISQWIKTSALQMQCLLKTDFEKTKSFESVQIFFFKFSFFFHRELCSFAFSKCKYMNWCILLLESLITNIERVMIRRVDIEFQQLFLKHFFNVLMKEEITAFFRRLCVNILDDIYQFVKSDKEGSRPSISQIGYKLGALIIHWM